MLIENAWDSLFLGHYYYNNNDITFHAMTHPLLIVTKQHTTPTA